jgi:hypothetical protein
VAPELKPREDEDTTQDHAFLGREFLTWLMWKADLGEASFGGKGDGAFQLVFGGRCRLAGLQGDVTDAVLKGRTPGLSVEARAGVGAGRTLREVELRLLQGEREWRFTLVADTLDLRGVKLPETLKGDPEAKPMPRRKGKKAKFAGAASEGEIENPAGFDERLTERLSLIEELDGFVKTAFGDFVKERTRPVWTRSVVPALRQWLVEGLAVTD